MALNVGYVEASCGPDVLVRIYYDQAWLATDATRDPSLAPLVNGPRGYCLDVTNTSGRRTRVEVSGVTGTPIVSTIPQGNPVTTGAARSRTAAQMRQAGFETRGDLGNVSLACDDQTA